MATPATTELVVSTKNLSRSDWLAHRRTGIGGSDAAALLGLHPYKTALDVYLDKVGLRPEEEAGEAAYWGTVLEPVVAQRFGELYPYAVTNPAEMWRHATHPFLLANVDRVLTDPANPERGPGILECKTASAFLAKAWSADHAPDHYLVQVQHYLAVTGFQWAYLAVLIGGQRFLAVEVPRDDVFIEQLVAAEAAFWDHVQRRDPPPLDGSDAASRLVKHLYPTAQDVTVLLPPEATAQVEAWIAAKEREKQAKQDAQAAQTLLQGWMGVAAHGVAGPYRLKWTNRTRRTLDQKALEAAHPDLVGSYVRTTTYRQFDIDRKDSANKEAASSCLPT